MKLFIEKLDGSTLEFESTPEAAAAVVNDVTFGYTELVRLTPTVAVRRSSIESVIFEDA